MWRQAERISRYNIDPARKTLFINSLNQMIDLHGQRVANYLFRAPPTAVLLLAGSGFIAVLVMGYASGVSRRRQTLGLTVMVILIVAVTAVIIDLENSGRGLIKPSQQPLLDAQRTIGAGDASGATHGGREQAAPLTTSRQTGENPNIPVH
jgi:hypothetical protein